MARLIRRHFQHSPAAAKSMRRRHSTPSGNQPYAAYTDDQEARTRASFWTGLGHCKVRYSRHGILRRTVRLHRLKTGLRNSVLSLYSELAPNLPVQQLLVAAGMIIAISGVLFVLRPSIGVSRMEPPSRLVSAVPGLRTDSDWR